MPMFECAWPPGSCANTVWVIQASLDVVRQWIGPIGANRSVFHLMCAVLNWGRYGSQWVHHFRVIRLCLTRPWLCQGGNWYQLPQWTLPVLVRLVNRLGGYKSNSCRWVSTMVLVFHSFPPYSVIPKYFTFLFHSVGFHSSLLHQARHLLCCPYKHKTILMRWSYLDASPVTTRLNLCL